MQNCVRAFTRCRPATNFAQVALCLTHRAEFRLSQVVRLQPLPPGVQWLIISMPLPEPSAVLLSILALVFALVRFLLFGQDLRRHVEAGRKVSADGASRAPPTSRPGLRESLRARVGAYHNSRAPRQNNLRKVGRYTCSVDSIGGRCNPLYPKVWVAASELSMSPLSSIPSVLREGGRGTAERSSGAGQLEKIVEVAAL